MSNGYLCHMEIRRVEDLIFEHFPFEPTSGQRILILALAEFILNHQQNEAFLFKGYAGTGKTTVLSALVKAAPLMRLKTVLLAPTGRAAKVLAAYSGRQAFTIHKKIYMPTTTAEGSVYLKLTENLHTNTLFIVDEASMIPGTTQPDSRMYANTDLLSDLIQYVYSGRNCSLALIGDTAQLPPVGADISPALDSKFLETAFNLRVRVLELKEVMRQSLDSGILANATLIRQKIENEDFSFPVFNIRNYPDIQSIDSTQLEDALLFSHKDYGDDKTIIITRSNKRANIFNREIRNRILFREDEIAAGDYMMVVRNNYFWLPKESPAGFIANGDIIEIQKIRRISEMYGFRFADVLIRLVDYPNHPEIETKLLLDTISAETPSLSPQDNQKFFDEVMKDYNDIPQRRKKLEKVKNNEWFNALQVKFAYTLTCHKTQGGQWETIFVDQPWLPGNTIDKEFLRWLYTAITRATGKVYLVNFKDEFFS
jgi:ATP-dependent exoDNAse (exonuclease V) alpha subunit